MQHRAGIERRHHLHDRDAGLRESLQNRGLQRRRAAQHGQHRAMNVQGAERWQIDHRLRQDAPVCDDDRDIGFERAHLRDELVAARFFRLQYGQTFSERDNFYRRRIELRARASTWGVDAGDNADDIVPLAEQCAQRRHGEIRCAPKKNAHGEGVPAYSESRSGGRSPTGRTRIIFGYWSFSSSQSRIAARRLRMLNRSMNILPCRWSISC